MKACSLVLRELVSVVPTSVIEVLLVSVLLLLSYFAAILQDRLTPEDSMLL